MRGRWRLGTEAECASVGVLGYPTSATIASLLNTFARNVGYVSPRYFLLLLLTLLVAETSYVMDVPFSSSGAMSRAHYALVRKVETATPQAADQILLAEVHTIRGQLTRSTLTLVSVEEE